MCVTSLGLRIEEACNLLQCRKSPMSEWKIILGKLKNISYFREQCKNGQHPSCIEAYILVVRYKRNCLQGIEYLYWLMCSRITKECTSIKPMPYINQLFFICSSGVCPWFVMLLPTNTCTDLYLLRSCISGILITFKLMAYRILYCFIWACQNPHAQKEERCNT